MWDCFYIEDPDGAPLGEPRDVLAKLKQAFPDLPYELKLEEGPLHVRPRSLEYMIEWFSTRGGMGYPQYEGYFGCNGVFRFLSKPSVMQIETGFICRNVADSDRDCNLPRLLTDTGWIRKPIKRRVGFFDLLIRH